jgi:radical SAM protein with 4Fe4S-binding SPASM domain
VCHSFYIKQMGVLKMNYKPITAVWEITMGCNMRCKHCGSSCEKPLGDELTTEEALDLCDDLGKLGFRWITLSGGEPTTRKDFYLIAKRLKENNIIPTMITNGWLLDEDIVDKAIEGGIDTIAISIDGLEETHDGIRKKGSFIRSMEALDLLKRKKMPSSVITTINNINIKELEKLKEIFIEKGVEAWQLQLALPMGNMVKNSDLVVQPFQVDTVIDFSYKSMLENKINIQLADCMGYFNMKEIAVRKHSTKTKEYDWIGCSAGKYTLGILNNGDIVGCTSVRDKSLIEGNIKITPINEIWENPNNFSWNRDMRKEKLEGLCGKCKYGNRCLGGCSNSKLTHGGSIYAENKYCSYNFALSKAKKQLDKTESVEELVSKGKKFIEKGNLQLAEMALSRALKLGNEDKEIMKIYGQTKKLLMQQPFLK